MSRLLNENWIAWAAGIVDGEGSIGIYGSGRASHAVHLQVGMTNKPALNVLARMFGGRVRPRSYTNKPAWTWHLTCRKAEGAIECLRPFLVVKREQATIALKLRRCIGKYGHSVPRHILRYRESLRLKMRRLNSGKDRYGRRLA